MIITSTADAYSGFSSQFRAAAVPLWRFWTFTLYGPRYSAGPFFFSGRFDRRDVNFTREVASGRFQLAVAKWGPGSSSVRLVVGRPLLAPARLAGRLAAESIP